MLAAKPLSHGVHAWLVNTGWTGGKYGVGSRIKLYYSRAIISTIAEGSLNDSKTSENHYFGFETVLDCAGVPSDVLDPSISWPDHSEYEKTAAYLAGLFIENFKQFEAGVAPEILKAGPVQGH